MSGPTGAAAASTTERWRFLSIGSVVIVDVTGAGNAYCGGFLVGLAETGDLEHAGRYGAVAASFALEQFGAMLPLDDLRARADRRLQRGS